MNRQYLSLLLLCIIPFANALGFGNMPSDREILFTPGGHGRIEFFVMNGDYIVASLRADEGDPAAKGTPFDNNILDYMQIVDPAPQTAGPRRVALVYNFPEQMKPGTYLVDILAKNVPPQQSSASVSAVAVVRMRFSVWVLGTEKRIEVQKPFLKATVETLPANASVKVTSRTTQNIQNTFADIRVYKNGELFTTKTTEAKALLSGETITLSTTLPTEELPGGLYPVNATVWYDGNSIETKTAILKIGTLHVEIPDYTERFLFNTTNRFLFNVSNLWNGKLRDVYATVTFGNQEKKTASQDIEPFSKTQYEIYFDRDPSVSLGTHNATITVFFKDYDRVLDEYVGKNEIFSKQLLVILPPEEQRPSFSPQKIALYAMMGIMILLLVAVLILLKKRGGDNKKEKKHPAEY